MWDGQVVPEATGHSAGSLTSREEILAGDKN